MSIKFVTEPATEIQLKRLFNPTVCPQVLQLQKDVISQHEKGIPNAYEIGYERFKQIWIGQHTGEERAAMYSIIFGLGTKTATLFEFPEATNNKVQQVYKIQRDKKDIIGMSSSKSQQFITGQQLEICCQQILKSNKDPTREQVIEHLRQFADNTIGKDKWDPSILAGGYVDMVERKLKAIKSGHNTSGILSMQQLQLLQAKKMQEVQARLILQQQQMAAYYSRKNNPVPTQDHACGGDRPWKEESSS